MDPCRPARAERVKELRFSPRTALNDLDLKLRHLRRMLEDGDRCDDCGRSVDGC